ncbi:MAG: ParB/RepB/Spo0J family partition protein [Rhodothermia bacterium]|nr:ParB/RepB/Spo0J family partition protein [Rhodothermia bacterium]
MAKKPALGKGLNALLPNAPSSSDHLSGTEHPVAAHLYRYDDRARALGRVAEIEISQIRPNPYQPRRDFDEQGLEDLASSIRQLGIIQPITVRAGGDGDGYELISGERRWRASRRAGLTKIPAYIREADSEAMLEMAIVENVQREDLNPIDVALGYNRLMEECGLTQEQVAEKVGKDRSTVTNFLRLLKLPPAVQAALRDGSLSNGHARALLPLPDAQVQVAFLKVILEQALSVRNTEDRIRTYLRKLKDAQETPETPTMPSVEELQVNEFTNRLRTYMSTKVDIKHRQDGTGRVEIAYYSQDDLERIMDLLTNK